MLKQQIIDWLELVLMDLTPEQLQRLLTKLRWMAENETEPRRTKVERE